jgi:hypothetical protein
MHSKKFIKSENGRKQGPWPLTSYSPGIDPKALVFALPADYLSPMKEAIEELERRISIIQAHVDTCRNERQKQMFQNGLQNARQVLANFLEMDRIFKGGAANGSSTT